MNNRKIVTLLESIVIESSNYQSIGTKLREIIKESNDQSLSIFVFAFEYMYVEKSMADQRQRYGAFAPWIEMEGKVFPPPLKVISPEQVETWSEVLELCKNPLLVSRLSDLLWEKRFGDRPDNFARLAVNNYLQVVNIYLIDLEKAEYLIRALEIARSIKDSDLTRNCISEIITLCKNELRQTTKRPGITLRLLQPLLELPKDKIPNEIDDLLSQSFDKYIDDPWITQNNIELIFKRADEAKKRDLQAYVIQRWINEAEKNTGIVRITHFQRALEIARNFGFSDQTDYIRNQLQNIHESDLDLKEISVTTEISKQEIEDFIVRFVNTKNLEESLIRFGVYGPPSGTLKENKETVENLSREAPLQFLITQQILDENNFPIMTAHNIDENKDLAIIRQETMGIQIFSTFGYPIIDRLVGLFDFSDKEKLLTYFTTPLIPIEIARNIIDAIDYYIQGKYYISALLLIPNIEAIFRNIARGVGLSIYHEPIASTPGRVRGLGEILHDINGKMDEDWRRYFCNILTNPIGLNLRNRLCHGLLTNLEKPEAFILIHAVCHLRLVAISNPTKGT